jgi:hypothetical protein
MKAFLERNKVCCYPFWGISSYISFRQNLHKDSDIVFGLLCAGA